MKKLAIAALAVAFAAATQAATIDWGVNFVLQDANFMEVQGTVMFFLSSDLNTPLANSPFAIGADGTVAGTVTGDDQTSWTARVNITNFDEGGEWAFDYVFDVDTVTHAGYADADTYLSGLSDAVGSAFLQDGALDLLASAESQGFSKVQPVPEPTTVALFALGLAAVGLKRKVA